MDQKQWKKLLNENTLISLNEKTDRSTYTKIPQMKKIADKYGLTEILFELLKIYQSDGDSDSVKITSKALKEAEKSVEHIDD